MSGLVAIFDPGGASPELLSGMCESVMHGGPRGPEKAFGCAAAGVTGERVSVAENGRACVLFHGDVFGREMRDGPAAFCLESFEEKGESFADGLNGQFVAALFDKEKEDLLLASDRMGSKPFYFHEKGGRFLFGTEVKAILRDGSVEKETDCDAVADFFAFGRVLGDKTLLKGVKVFPPATVMRISRGGKSSRSYWDMDFDEDYDDSQDPEGHYAGKLASALRTSVGRRLGGDCHFTLSGGLDTRIVVSLARELEPRIKAFTIGEDSHDEVRLSKSIAALLGLEHSIVKPRVEDVPESLERCVFMGDGMTTCRHAGFFSSVGTIGKGRDVIISSAGLGELLGDYFVNESCFGLDGEALAMHCYKNLNKLFSDKEMKLLFTGSAYGKVKGRAYETVKSGLEGPGRHARLPANRLYRFLFRSDLRRVIFASELTASALNAKLPSLDSELLEFMLGVPPELRAGRRLEFAAISRLFPEVAKIPYNQTGFPVSYPMKFHKIGYRYEENASYRKLNEKLRSGGRDVFIPDRIEYLDLPGIMRKDKKVVRFFEENLLGKKAMERGYFNIPYVKGLLREHVSGRRDNSDKLCALLTFELWHRLFIDG